MNMQLRKVVVYLVFAGGLVAANGCAHRHGRVLAQLPAPVLTANVRGQSTQVHFRQDVTRQAGLADQPSPSPQDFVVDRDIPASWYPPIASHRWKAIVIHHSAGENGCAKAFDKAHRARGWDELGYHFVIGNGRDKPDGLVEVGSRWRKQKHGAHCKTASNFYNDHGIGICLVGNFEHHYPTAKQMRSLKKLLLFLTYRYDIPPEHVYGHGDLGRTKCPGRYLSVRRLVVWLQAQRQVYAMSR